MYYQDSRSVFLDATFSYARLVLTSVCLQPTAFRAASDLTGRGQKATSKLYAKLGQNLYSICALFFLLFPPPPRTHTHSSEGNKQLAILHRHKNKLLDIFSPRCQELISEETFGQVLSDFLYTEAGAPYQEKFKWNGKLACNSPAPKINVRLYVKLYSSNIPCAFTVEACSINCSYVYSWFCIKKVKSKKVGRSKGTHDSLLCPLLPQPLH